MRDCLECSRETANKKFCSRSCSVKFNNEFSPKRHKEDPKCSRCGNSVEKRNRVCGDCNRRTPTLFVNKKWDELNRDDYRRKRLIKERGQRCEKCLRTSWEGQQIPVEVDHIDGNHFNNDISNVRLLCPNCHAQTSTYRGRNKRKRGVG